MENESQSRDDDEDFAPFVSSVVQKDNLKSLLTHEQKQCFASLCFLTFNELSLLYADFEFFDKSVSSKISKSSKTVVDEEDVPLLESVISGYQNDENTKKTVSYGSIDLLFMSEKVYVPFKEILDNPEDVQDLIYLRKNLNGNILLAHAMRSVESMTKNIMDSLYFQLNLTHEEKIFVEQSRHIGLSISDLIAPLLPKSEADSVNMSTMGDMRNDIRPILLWNLTLTLARTASISGNNYDSRYRVFLKRIAVDYLKYGSWVDVVEEIENPIFDLLSSNKTEDLSSLGKTLDSMSISARSALLMQNQTKSNEIRKRNYKRWGLMAAAAVSGGTIIGLSAGIAAPIIGAGLGTALTAMHVAGASAFLTSTTASAIITSGAVISGTGYAGYKMAKRTRDVEVFTFIPIQSNDRKNVIISIAGWAATKDAKGKNIPRPENTKTLSQSTPKRKKPLTKENLDRAEGAGGGSPKSGSEGTSAMDDRDKTSEILISGMEDLIMPFMGISPVMGSHYALCTCHYFNFRL
jgi:hypothetical protein